MIEIFAALFLIALFGPVILAALGVLGFRLRLWRETPRPRDELLEEYRERHGR